MRFTWYIFAQFSAYASVMGLYLSIIPWGAARSTLHWSLIIILSLAAIVFLIVEARRASLENHLSMKSDAHINTYMCKWISNRGRAVILSRDLSWGNKFNTKTVLLNKSKRKELVIFMQSETTLSKELASAGADLHYYGKEFSPQSRFTIIGEGKAGSRIAVGTEKKGRHIVYEYDTGEHPITALSDDLIALLRKIA